MAGANDEEHAELVAELVAVGADRVPDVVDHFEGAFVPRAEHLRAVDGVDALVAESVRESEADLDDFAAALARRVGSLVARGRERVFGAVVVLAACVPLVDGVQVVGAIPRAVDGDAVGVPALEAVGEVAQLRLPLVGQDVVDVHRVGCRVVHVGEAQQAHAHLTLSWDRPERVGSCVFDRIRVDVRHASVTRSQRRRRSQNE